MATEKTAALLEEIKSLTSLEMALLLSVLAVLVISVKPLADIT